MFKSIAVRHPKHRFLALVVFLGSAGLIGLAAQPPREVEDPKSKTFKKIVVDDEGTIRKKTVDDDPMPQKGPDSSPPDVRLDELVRAADEARTNALRDLFAKFIIPFDRITEGGGALSVKPIPIRRSKWGGAETIVITPLDHNGKALETRSAKVSDIKNVEHFESILLEEVEKFQKQKLEGLTIPDQLAAAEKLLAAALRFHDFSRRAREKPLNIRRGAGWDEIREPLAKKLYATRVDLLQAFVAANDRTRLHELMSRLMAAYPDDKKMAETIAAVQVGEAEKLLKSGSDQDSYTARRLLDELELNFPGMGGEPAQKLRAQLRDLALKALKRAKEKQELGEDRIARDELARAVALDPDLEGIREMQRKLNLDYPILSVGVRQFPQYMSPATARLDSEKQAVELVFEGLLEEVPDPSGAVQYRPGAALTMPQPIPGGREFLLRTDRQGEKRSSETSGRPGFDSHDVVGTWTLLHEYQYTWYGYPLMWLAPEPPIPKDNATVRVAFGYSHPDPRSALTFKLLPTRWMFENGRKIDDGRFAEKPFGTGPFMFQSKSLPDGSNNPREMVFVNNPSYGRRDRQGLPNLREVRLIEASKLDPIKAFQEGKLHILTDVPTSEIDRYAAANSTIRSKVDVVTANFNRRVHILAVNLRRPYLQNRQLRQGISLAIDREEILRKAYRDGKPEYHQYHHVMNGPFPPSSWAAGKGTAVMASLTNQDLAVVRLKSYLADQGATKAVELAYPDDDPQAEKACFEIKRQVESVFKNEPAGTPKLTINLVKLPQIKLLVNVQDEHASYDLAYIPFDYPDDWYPYALGAALDPGAAGRSGRNWFSFLTREANPDAADQELGRALPKIRQYRDFAGELVPQTLAIGKLFNDSLPFIPLWQLDRHMVVSKKVKVFVDDTLEPVTPRLLNQTVLFQGVGRWRVE